MRVFLSWSGARSKAVASALRDWLPLVIQNAEPWFSPEDIDKGARWLSSLSSELSQQSVAIVCLTPENAQSPWLLFEAGALSKTLDSSWVCPLLYEIEPSEVTGPLAQFQSTRASKEEIRALLSTLSKRLTPPLPDSTLDTLHEALWPKLQERLETIGKAEVVHPQHHRDQQEMLAEVLDRVRQLERTMSAVVEGRDREIVTAGIEAVEKFRTMRSYADGLTREVAVQAKRLQETDATLMTMKENEPDEFERLHRERSQLALDLARKQDALAVATRQLARLELKASILGATPGGA